MQEHYKKGGAPLSKQAWLDMYGRKIDEYINSPIKGDSKYHDQTKSNLYGQYLSFMNGTQCAPAPQSANDLRQQMAKKYPPLNINMIHKLLQYFIYECSITNITLETSPIILDKETLLHLFIGFYNLDMRKNAFYNDLEEINEEHHSFMQDVDEHHGNDFVYFVDQAIIRFEANTGTRMNKNWAWGALNHCANVQMTLAHTIPDSHLHSSVSTLHEEHENHHHDIANDSYRSWLHENKLVDGTHEFKLWKEHLIELANSTQSLKKPSTGNNPMIFRMWSMGMKNPTEEGYEEYLATIPKPWNYDPRLEEEEPDQEPNHEYPQ